MKVIDLHQDLLYHLRGEGGVKAGSQTSIEMLAASDVNLLVASVFVHPDFSVAAPSMIERELLEYVALAERNGWQIIRNGYEIDYLTESDFGLLLHIEGQNRFPKCKFNTLKHWYELGWRSLGPVWNQANEMGGGCLENETRLSENGRVLVQWCNQRGIVVDLAHMNENTFHDTFAIQRSPLVVSHANYSELRPCVRNLDKRQLGYVAVSRGVIGVTFVNGFLVDGGRATVCDVADHIEHIRDWAGLDHVAIGSDFGGILDGGVIGLQSVEELPNLWNELSQRNWTDKQIEQLAWGNAARVLKKILP